MVLNADEAVEFGTFRLEPARRLLTRLGVPVDIGGHALDVLLALVEHAPHIVSKSALLDRAWSGVLVDESNLRLQISTLRKLLGDGESGNRYISTVTGRGYCFVAPLARLRSVSPDEPSPRTNNEQVGNAAMGAPRPPAAETNLPHPITNIIGRARELSELPEHLRQNRLVTLLGPGGVGKTRLAVELGRQMLSDFPGGVWLIDLAPLTGPSRVAGATAAVLGVALPNADAAVETIAAAIGRQRTLLIFDNCEYLVGAAAELIGMLLKRAPGLSVLATSQEDLQIPAEQVYRLDPLAVPPSGAVEIKGFGAADLFVERARAADRLFELRGNNVAGIAEICRRLDGIPLALEMAAARLCTLGVAGLCAGLDDRLHLLKGASPVAARHDSLRAMLEWSYGLLDPRDRQIFRRLAVFPAGFSLDAAVAVAREEGSGHWDTVDALGRLLDKSLVTIENREPRRYRLLETLRLYAGAKLRASGEADAVAERHAQYFMTVFDRADIAWETMPDPEWIALYRPEIDNLRAALDWALADLGRRQIAISLAGASGHLLHVLSLIAEGRGYINRTIPLIDQDTPPAIAARLLMRGTRLLYDRYNPTTRSYAARAAALYRQLDDRLGLAYAFGAIGLNRIMLGEYAEAKTILLEAWALLADIDFTKAQLVVANQLGALALRMNDMDAARRYFMQVLKGRRATKSAFEITSLMNLAELEFDAGNIELAIEHGREALACARARSRPTSLGLALCNLASHLIILDNPAEVRELAEEAFALLVEKGGFGTGFCLQLWAMLGAYDGRFAEAAQLIGFVDAEYARRGETRWPTDQQLYDQLTGLLEAANPAADIEAWKAEGARWSEAEAIGFVSSRFFSEEQATQRAAVELT